MKNGALTAIQQVIAGRDFDSPARLLAPIKADTAVIDIPGFPYTIATNLLHAHFWNKIWLDRLEGRKPQSFTEDWKVADSTIWLTLCSDFLAGLDRASEIASADPFTHHMKSDQAATEALTQIAIHTAYHLGQIKLMKRVLRAQKRST